MTAALITSYSDGNREVYDLSFPNHRAYCNRHGYALVDVEEPYNRYFDTDRIREYLAAFDLVATIGTDVVIRRPELPLEGFAHPGLTMCRELGGGTLNADLVIYTRDAATYAILDLLDGVQFEFVHGQEALNALVAQGVKGVTEEPLLQIAAPQMNPRADYSRVDIGRFFAVHYHSMGALPIPATKAAVMRSEH